MKEIGEMGNGHHPDESCKLFSIGRIDKKLMKILIFPDSSLKEKKVDFSSLRSLNRNYGLAGRVTGKKKK